MIQEQGAAWARKVLWLGLAQSSHRSRFSLQRAPRIRQERRAAASRLGRNARHSSMGRACTSCGLVTASGGQAYAVLAEDEENCIEGTLEVFPTPERHPSISVQQTYN